uniref:RHS repeat domain-containing protein n=1 Tax=Prevotella sp. TaxID=59823 RepID=UPI0027E3A74C
NHPTAPTQIGHDHYTYDANGNPTLVTNDSTNTTREMYWDEDNRLMVLSDNGKTSRYTYNAAGERIMKSYGTMEGVYINGAPQGITFHETDNFTLYPTSIISINKNRFTKHYFLGDKRVASRIGTGLFNNVYGRNGSYVTAGQQDYAERMNQIQKQKEAYYKEQGIAPGVPTMKGAYGDPENTGVGYNAVLTELGNHDVPQGWIQTPRPNTTPNTNPGPPVSWNDPSNPDDPQAGYGYIPNDTTKEETFFYHSDHLGSTSYITDDHANITQYDAYLPYGELLVDEHSSSEELPYKFNGKQFDDETGLYYYGARYMNPVTSLWYGVDPLAEKYVATGGYVYTLDNPVRLIDPNGNWSWPWERGSLIEYRGNGVFGIRIENFSKTMQSNFKRANNNPANWRPGELGINTEIGKISVDNYAHKSFTIGRKPAGIDPKDGNVRIRRPIAKSTGQEDRRFHSFDPMPVRGSAKAVGAIAILDFANYAVDTYMTLSTFWDSNAFDDQMASFRKAIRAVNSQMNSIPDNYRKDTNKMGAIPNEPTLKSKACFRCLFITKIISG